MASFEETLVLGRGREMASKGLLEERVSHGQTLRGTSFIRPPARRIRRDGSRSQNLTVSVEDPRVQSHDSTCSVSVGTCSDGFLHRRFHTGLGRCPCVESTPVVRCTESYVSSFQMRIPGVGDFAESHNGTHGVCGRM